MAAASLGYDTERSQHTHRTVWSAATNLETHEDGSAPRLGVEYRKKNGNGTGRYAGTVQRVVVDRPETHFGHEDSATPRIVFERDDGHRMYVEPDGLYTTDSHAPYVGSIVALTTSTTSTVEVPDVEASSEDSQDSAQDDTVLGARVASVDSMEKLRSVVERYADDARVEVCTTTYSWDIPGFGRQNDPHSGRTAKRGGECAYLVVRGPRCDLLEQALAKLAHEHNLAVSENRRRATLVPPQGGL